MPGFCISNFEQTCSLKNVYQEKCISESMYINGYNVARNTLKKFEEDKIFYQNDEYVIITEGVILNRKNLMDQCGERAFINTIIKMVAEYGVEFFEKFRGSFCGALYDKRKDTWYVYTNHIGDKPLFYYCDNGKFAVGAQVNYVLDTIRLNGKVLSLDEKAVYDMLTFAFMEKDSTYAREIKRLQAGHYLEIKSGKVSVKKYFEFDRKAFDLNGISESELIDLVDEKFRNAVGLEFDKDCEYGYEFYSDLSGGLDSRMTMWIGAEMGYLPMTHLTYCQANYKDELIAKEIADYWDNEIVVKSLNDARFLLDIDKIVHMNAGLSLYSGITGGMRLLEMLDSQKMGLEHTGQLGDVVLGSFYKKREQIGEWNLTGMYSERIKDKIDTAYKKSFCDNEMYLLYTRGFQGATCTHLIRQNYTEVGSPFIDVDFLQLCCSIPPEFRIGHNLYIKWILNKYPGAAKFEWEKTGCRINANKMELFMEKVKRGGMYKLRYMLRIPQKISSNGMNPMDFWYATKTYLKSYMDDYLIKNLEHEILDSEMKKLISDYYTKGSTIEKTQALTVLGAINFYFGK